MAQRGNISQESFGQAFSKACATEGAEPSSPSADDEILLTAFSFANFSFVIYASARPVDDEAEVEIGKLRSIGSALRVRARDDYVFDRIAFSFAPVASKEKAESKFYVATRLLSLQL